MQSCWRNTVSPKYRVLSFLQGWTWGHGTVTGSTVSAEKTCNVILNATTDTHLSASRVDLRFSLLTSNLITALVNSLMAAMVDDVYSAKTCQSCHTVWSPVLFFFLQDNLLQCLMLTIWLSTRNKIMETFYLDQGFNNKCILGTCSILIYLFDPTASPHIKTYPGLTLYRLFLPFPSRL